MICRDDDDNGLLYCTLCCVLPKVTRCAYKNHTGMNFHMVYIDHGAAHHCEKYIMKYIAHHEEYCPP